MSHLWKQLNCRVSNKSCKTVSWTVNKKKEKEISVEFEASGELLWIRWMFLEVLELKVVEVNLIVIAYSD